MCVCICVCARVCASVNVWVCMGVWVCGVSVGVCVFVPVSFILFHTLFAIGTLCECMCVYGCVSVWCLCGVVFVPVSFILFHTVFAIGTV